MKQLLLLLTAIYPSLLNAQNNYIKITPISKYGFEIQNLSEFTLIIKVGNLEPELFMPAYSKQYSSASLKTQAVQLFYPHHLYIRQKDAISKRMKSVGFVQKEINALSKEFLFNRDRSPKIIQDRKYDFADGVDQPYERMETQSEADSRNLTTDVIIAFGNYIGNKSTEEKKVKLQEIYSENESLYAGSTGVTNEYDKVFEPIQISSYITKGKGRQGISPRFGFEIEYGFKVSALNENWNKGTDGRMSFSFPLIPEWRLGNSNFFLKFYGHIGFEGNQWKLNYNKGPYYVSSKYTDNVSTDYHQLENLKKISLVTQHYNGGIFLKLFVNKYFFSDFGVGYNTPFYISEINFDSTNYLSNAKLIETKIKNVFKKDKFYPDNYNAFIKAGFLISKRKNEPYRRYKGIGITLGGRVHRTNRVVSENYLLYKDTNGEIVPVASHKTIFSLSAGLNIFF